MPDNNTQPPTEEQNNDLLQSPAQSAVVGDFSEGSESRREPAFRPTGSAGKEHSVLKVYVVVSLIVLILNTLLLSTALIPFAGIYIILGAAPILLCTGVLGLANLFIVTRSLFKNHFAGSMRKLEVVLLVLSIIAVAGGASSPLILMSSHEIGVKNQQLHDEANSYYSEITFEKGTELLNDCKIYSLNYNNPKGSDWEKTPETTSSGILIYDEYAALKNPSSAWDYARGKYIMYIADRTVDTIVPIARQAQETCDIEFHHDNMDEE